MHGSTSPSKNGESPNSGPQVTLRQTRSIAVRAGALAGSSPRSRRNNRVYMFDHQSGAATPSPQWPSMRCRSSSRGPHPSDATRDRSAATISAGVSVRSRITCQRIDGSASRSQPMTGSAADRWRGVLAVNVNPVFVIALADLEQFLQPGFDVFADGVAHEVVGAAQARQGLRVGKLPLLHHDRGLDVPVRLAQQRVGRVVVEVGDDADDAPRPI